MTLREKIFNTDLCDFLFSINENIYKVHSYTCILDLLNGKTNECPGEHCSFSPDCHKCINKALNMQYEDFMKGI